MMLFIKGIILLFLMHLNPSKASPPPTASASASACTTNSSFFTTFPFLTLMDETTPARFRSQETSVIMQFAKFANKKAPQFLNRMVKEKRLYLAQRSVNHAEQIINLSHNDNTNNNSNMLLTSLSDLVNLTRQLLSLLISDALISPDNDNEWEKNCHDLWWPLSVDSVDSKQADLCWQLRCTACAPAVAAAAAACKRIEHLAHKCLQKVMGEGFCNYCLADYLDER